MRHLHPSVVAGAACPTLQRTNEPVPSPRLRRDVSLRPQQRAPDPVHARSTDAAPRSSAKKDRASVWIAGFIASPRLPDSWALEKAAGCLT